MPKEPPYFSCVVTTEQTPTQARAYQRAGDRLLKEFKRFKAASIKNLCPFESVAYQLLLDGRWEWKIVYQLKPGHYNRENLCHIVQNSDEIRYPTPKEVSDLINAEVQSLTEKK